MARTTRAREDAMTFRKTELGVLLAGSLLLTGAAFADDGHERTDEHIEKIKHAEKEMNEARKQVDKALDAYHELLTEAGDRRSAYKDLAKALERCEERGKELDKKREEMDKQAERFFKEWKKSLKDIKSGDLRSRSERRLEDTRDRYHRVAERWKAMRERYQPLTSRLEDQVVYLGHDLNAASTSSLQEDARKVEDLADALLRAMDDFGAEAQGYVSSLSS